jgi:hypothetical protein
MSAKNEIDEFFCKGCKKSMVGSDGFCMNCGHDTTCESDPRYEDEDLSDVEGLRFSDLEDLDFGENLDD